MGGGDFALGRARRDGELMVVPATVPMELRYLEGHFPGNPIVPGVAQLMLVEKAARVAWPGLPPCEGLERLKFQARIDPGESLEIHLERVEAGRVRFRILRGDQVCTRGTLRLGA